MKHMNTKTRRITGAVMSAAMLLSAAAMPCQSFLMTQPLTAFAAEAESVTPAAAEKIEEGDFTFDVYEKYAEVTSYKGSDTAVKIPAEAGGKPVTKIGYGAFQGNKKITSFELPESVTEISRGAFQSCTGLTELDIPAHVKEVAIEAFRGCSNVKKVTLHEGLETAGQGAFSGVPITEIYIPSTLTEATSAFYGHNELKKVTFSSQLNRVPYRIFYGCKGIEEIKVPINVTKINSEAFSGCSALTKITIMNKACEIQGEAATISNTAVIRCRKGSTAEAYGTKYERKIDLLPDEPVETGDYDGDDLADAEDAQNVLNVYADILAGNEAKLSDAQKKTCDVNGDGEIDSADAQLILLYYVRNTVAGLPTEWSDLTGK